MKAIYKGCKCCQSTQQVFCDLKIALERLRGIGITDIEQSKWDAYWGMIGVTQTRHQVTTLNYCPQEHRTETEGGTP